MGAHDTKNGAAPAASETTPTIGLVPASYLQRARAEAAESCADERTRSTGITQHPHFEVLSAWRWSA